MSDFDFLLAARPNDAFSQAIMVWTLVREAKAGKARWEGFKPVQKGAVRIWNLIIFVRKVAPESRHRSPDHCRTGLLEQTNMGLG
ncbi:MAG: hypothetical protein EOM25_14575 [Deltaproteobacteria bacterium]|nr:hypothetical protein [Deltaproteobacteria bacterium]